MSSADSEESMSSFCGFKKGKEAIVRGLKFVVG